MPAPRELTTLGTDADLVEFVLNQHDDVPADVDAARFKSAVDYSAKRFEVGLSHYEAVVRRLGFTGAARALDVGSGAGHWCVALARHNDRVDGLERSPEFVAVARRVAEAAGLAERISYHVGSAEDFSLPSATFELVSCHSVLMYVDHEPVMRNIARWTAPGGLYYCGYTSWPARVAAAVDALVAGRRPGVETQLRMLIGDELFRVGVGRTYGSSMRCLSLKELIGQFEAVGFQYLESPGVQDGPRAFLGHESTVDLICRRGDDDPPGAPFEEAPAGERRRWLENLIAVGLPRLALETMDGAALDIADPGVLDLRLRATLKAGQSLEPDAPELARLPTAARHWLTAVSRYIAADFDAAVEACRVLPSEHPDRGFLLSAFLLAAKRFDEARALVLETYPHGADLVREWAVLTIAVLEVEGIQAARRLTGPLVMHLAETGGASTRERDRIIGRLKGSSGG